MLKVLVPLISKQFKDLTRLTEHIHTSYSLKLKEYGIMPLFVSGFMSKKMIDDLYKQSQGVMMIGGPDFNEKFYGENPHPKSKAHTHVRSDENDIYILKKVFKDKKPFLGICRGAQALVIASGGKLYRYLPDRVEEKHSKNKGFVYHDVYLEEGSKIRNLLNQEKIKTNSRHKQAARSVGKDLIISGKTKAGIAEIIEHKKDFFCFGFQSHPEEDDQELEIIFKEFVKSLKKQKQ